MSYSGDPSASLLDEVRFLIFDTSNDPTRELLSDDEITYAIGKLAPTYSDALMYAAYCADRIVALYAGEISISADGVSASVEGVGDKYLRLAETLRNEYATLYGVGAAPFAGGSMWGDHVYGTRPLNFGIGSHDNIRAGRQDNERDDSEDGNPWP